MMRAKKSDFLNYEIWILTFGGGLQRSGVYADNISDANKTEFRNSVKDKINTLVINKYTKSPVTSKEHINNLVNIKNWINSNHSHVLKNQNIKLGIVQKLLKDRKSTRLNSSHIPLSRMPSSA